MNPGFEINPKLDLVIERTVDVPVELVWKAWTQAEHLKQWFVPRPWRISHCEIDLRPGGCFTTTMCSPDGKEFPNAGCYLEIVECARLVWTSALLPAFRPAPKATNGPDLLFTAYLLMESHGEGARYKAIALHQSEEGCKKHDEMGFKEGWGTCMDQMLELIKSGAVK